MDIIPRIKICAGEVSRSDEDDAIMTYGGPSVSWDRRDQLT